VTVNGRYLAGQFRHEARYLAAYVTNVRSEILPSFADLTTRANAVEEREYQRLCKQPAPEDFDGDLSGCAEAAWEAGMFYYSTMEALRWTLLALCSAGLYHSLEQKLAALCHDASFGVKPPLAELVKGVLPWYKKYLRIDLRNLPAWKIVDELRLVANTAKHAAGKSAEHLRAIRPDLFEDPRLREALPAHPFMYETTRVLQPLAGEDLFVSEETFAAYGDAVCDFMDQIAHRFEANPDELFFPQSMHSRRRAPFEQFDRSD
jgi:hypothetical protein